MTYIRAWMSLKFGQNRPWTTEVAALKRLKNCCFHFFLALYNGSQVSIVALWATCFLIQFNVPFKIISLIETSQKIGGAKREYPGKTT